MGSCVSVDRDSDSAMKLRLSFGSKTVDKLVVIPTSPVKEDKPTNGIGNGDCPMINYRPLKSHWSPSRSTTTNFRDHGSREDAFFDSQPWLESDCEDDFYSVNGDFTPSRGNTPVHQSFAIGSSRVNKTPVSIPASSPTKKKLVDLFRESFRDDEDVDEENFSGNQSMGNGKAEVKQTTPNLLPKAVNGSTPYISGPNSVCSSERTVDGDVPNEKEKPIRSVQCCLPSFVSYRSSSQRKKMSPTIAVIDKA